jgi:hypothetical protein
MHQQQLLMVSPATCTCKTLNLTEQVFEDLQLPIWECRLLIVQLP